MMTQKQVWCHSPVIQEGHGSRVEGSLVYLASSRPRVYSETRSQQNKQQGSRMGPEEEKEEDRGGEEEEEENGEQEKGAKGI